MDSLSRYSIPSKIMHAVMGLLIVGMIAFGLSLGSIKNSVDSDTYISLIMLHKSTGILIMILALLRLLFFVISPVPELPRSLTSFERFWAVAVRRLMYLWMFVMPLSGYLMSNAAGRPVLLFGLPMPTLISENKNLIKMFAGAHEFLAISLLVLLTIHILATIKHTREHGSSFLKRMF